jgi:hypothetical protein
MQALGAIVGAFMAMLVDSESYIGPYECFGIYLLV